MGEFCQNSAVTLAFVSEYNGLGLFFGPGKDWTGMDNCLMVFASITTANGVRQVLLRHGIQCYVVQTPRALPVSGCSYSVKCKTDDLERAWALVQQLDVYTKGTFLERDHTKLK